MATVRVGVKRVDKGMEPRSVGAKGVEIQQRWVEINGHRHNADDIGLMRVDYDPGENPGEEFAMTLITVVVAGEGFSTADYREPPPANNPEGVQPDSDKVICPNCSHQFGAVPVNVQAAIRSALEELGVPTEDYPAPVANAVALLSEALP